MPTYVVSLAGNVPPARYDSVAWTKAKLEEASSETGSYSLIETFTLSPVDSDPTNPAARNFTSAKATASTNWYRISFEDASGNLALTSPVFNAAQGSASLCGIADVRALLQSSTSDTGQNALIEHMIPQASEAVSKDCEREFAPAQSGLTRTFEWRWESRFLSLAPYDLRSVTEIKIDTDVLSGGVKLSTEEYRVFPQPPRDGTYTALRLQPRTAALGQLHYDVRQVQVTGNWGFESIPRDVVQATALTVVHWLRVNTAVFPEPGEGVEGQPPRRGIPSEAWELLSRYRRSTLI